MDYDSRDKCSRAAGKRKFFFGIKIFSRAKLSSERSKTHFDSSKKTAPRLAKARPGRWHWLSVIARPAKPFGRGYRSPVVGFSFRTFDATN
jgi:hypothetical protein